jgi:hypothetical protein
MTGNRHVRFLGEGAAATPLSYPTRRNRHQRGTKHCNNAIADLCNTDSNQANWAFSTGAGVRRFLRTRAHAAVVNAMTAQATGKGDCG